MIKAPSKLLSVGVAITFATALFMTSNARIVPVARAHDAYASLPTLHMSFWNSKGKLARRLDPALINSTNEYDTIEMVYDNLVVIGTDDKVHLQLASKYTVNKAHTVYTFTIRPDAKFSNGDPVTAADEEFSIKRTLDPKTASDVATTYLGVLKGAADFNAGKSTDLPGVKVLGTRVIQFILDKPYAYFLKTLTYPTADPLDPKVVSGQIAAPTNNYITNNCPGNVATGPFMFQCFGNDFFPSGQTPSYTLVPNKFYYGKKPTYKIFMLAYADVPTQYKAYLAGTEDAAYIPTAFLSQWAKSPQELKTLTSTVFYLSPAFKSAPFSDVHCRLAVAYGIDRVTVDSKILHHAVNPIYSVLPPHFVGYYTGADSPHFNLKKAKQEFQACSLNSTPITLKYATTGTDSDNEAAAYVSMLTNVGFNIKVQPLQENDWLNVVGNGQTEDKTNTTLVINGWQQDYPDPQDYMENLLTCSSSYNITGWCSQKFDALNQKADFETNVKKRAAIYIQMQKIAIDQAASWITLWNGVGYALHKPYVKGLTLSVAFADIVAKNLDWGSVTVGKH